MQRRKTGPTGVAGNEFYSLTWYESAKRARSYVSRNFPRGTKPFNIRLSIVVRSNMIEVGRLHIGIFILRKSNASYLLTLSDFLLRKHHILQVYWQIISTLNTNLKLSSRTLNININIKKILISHVTFSRQLLIIIFKL